MRPFYFATTLVCLLVCGCGGGTRTVTISSAPTQAPSESARTEQHTLPNDRQSTSTTSPSQRSSGATGGTPDSTRTSEEPRFSRESAGSDASGAATGIVREHGYTPNDASEYRSGQTLTALIGTRTGSADGYDQRAFFFVNGRYIGTDSSQPSASVRVVRQSDTEVTLSYALYRSKDPLCCPSAGHTEVTFQLNNGRLQPLQSIPTADANAPVSRF